MKPFMDDDFMLTNDTAVKLYHNYAENMPIFDYHCHLSPRMMYEDKPFGNITEIFLGGDHYKWRYMRSNGIDEKYITGDADDYDKFKAFCSCLKYAIGNPLYHWTHLELKRYFGVESAVTEENCDKIWEQCNKVIKDSKMSPSSLINSSNVAVICTTDDPVDSLEWHKKIKEKGHIKAKVCPAFRPDFLINIEKETFKEYIEKLEKVSGIKISSYDDLLSAVYNRIDYFHAVGCRISDHALDGVPFNNEHSADTVLKRAIVGGKLSSSEIEAYKCSVLIDLAKKYKSLGWTMQLHIGALRNNNARMFEKLGADTGFDSIADYAIAAPLSALLNAMDETDNLPKTILYTLNPKDNYVLATMIGNFQSSETAGKIQFGSAWWFNDQRDGMVEQMKALANLGALNKFVGMLTDSRSFLSYTRHEYFRRILCNLIGTWVEKGEFPEDYEILGKIVGDISFNNAVRYFGIQETEKWNF